MTKITHFFHNIDTYLFRHPRSYLFVIALVTVFFAWKIPGLKMYSDFADLLPQTHPYIQLHNEIKDTFGGANVIIVGIEVEQGDIFNNDTLALIHRMTLAVDNLPGVNHNLVSSVTHRNSRKIWLTPVGNIESEPYYKPDEPNMPQERLDEIRKDIVANPRIYGPLVSPDMKVALIKAQLNEGQLDYEKTFGELQAVRKSETRDGVNIYATGTPVLVGWCYTYKEQIYQIFLFTALIMISLLIFHFRKLYGVFIPLGRCDRLLHLGPWHHQPVRLQRGPPGARHPLSDLGPGHEPRDSAGGPTMRSFSIMRTHRMRPARPLTACSGRAPWGLSRMPSVCC